MFSSSRFRFHGPSRRDAGVAAGLAAGALPLLRVGGDGAGGRQRNGGRRWTSTRRRGKSGLAAAIATRNEAADRLEKAKAAEAQAGDLLMSALVRLEEARAAIVEAHEAAPQRLLEAAASGVLTMDRPLTAAWAAEADAEHDVAALRRAVAAARAAIAEAEKALMLSQIRVDSACKPVLAADLGRILAATEGLKRQFDETRATLAFLAGPLPPGSPLRLKVDDALECAPARNLEPPAEWRKAREALMRDARAPLPSEIN